MITYGGSGKSKARAALIKEQLEIQKREKMIQESSIDLYPQAEPNNYYLEKHAKDNQIRVSRNKHISFQESVMKELALQAIYAGMVEPVLEEALANDHHKELAWRTAKDFVNEQNVYDMIRDWKYKNIYLAEFAQKIDKAYNLITETARDKIREGLSEKDVYQIENQKLNDYIIDVKDVIPKDITQTITRRVEDSVNDFIADNQDKRDKILMIYQKAQDKVMSASDPDSNPLMKQAYPDGQSPDDVDPQLMSQAEPGNARMDPNTGALPGTNNPNISEIQQEALWIAKRKENKILNEGTETVFGAMTKILSEAALTVPSLKQSYLNENGKLNMSKILGDVRSIYTFLEALNTIGVIKVTPNYIENTLQGMKESLEKISNDEKKTPTGDKLEPKEKTHNDGSGNDNNPANDFDF